MAWRVGAKVPIFSLVCGATWSRRTYLGSLQSRQRGDSGPSKGRRPGLSNGSGRGTVQGLEAPETLIPGKGLAWDSNLFRSSASWNRLHWSCSHILTMANDMVALAPSTPLGQNGLRIQKELSKQLQKLQKWLTTTFMPFQLSNKTATTTSDFKPFQNAIKDVAIKALLARLSSLSLCWHLLTSSVTKACWTFLFHKGAVLVSSLTWNSFNPPFPLENYGAHTALKLSMSAVWYSLHRPGHAQASCSSIASWWDVGIPAVMQRFFFVRTSPVWQAVQEGRRSESYTVFCLLICKVSDWKIMSSLQKVPLRPDPQSPCAWTPTPLKHSNPNRLSKSDNVRYDGSIAYA